MSKLRFGVVGKNYTAKFVSASLKYVPDVEVSAICTTQAQTARAAAEELGIPKAYGSAAELIADPSIDAVIAGGRPSVRDEIVEAALEAGKHVYNLIPFATSEPKARRLRDLAKRNGLVGIADAQWTWVPALRRMREIQQEGGLGEFWTASLHLYLAMVENDGARYSTCSWSGITDPYLWLSEASSGCSAWRNFGTHSILNLTHFFGEIEEVVGTANTFLKEMILPDGTRIRPQTDDFGHAIVKFKNGGVANINVSWAMADAPGYRFEVCGSKGRMLVEDSYFCSAAARLYVGDASQPSTFDGRNGRWVELPSRLRQVAGGQTLDEGDWLIPYAAMFTEMARAIRTGEGEAHPSFSEAYHAHCAMEAVVRSMQTKSWVKVADIESGG
ncbi:MAG: Gfo/Idh/MocA family oxidoreductase [Caulobacteraceae bacterium]|nr:Gfo/Idh/MocA family oxidoreductase [Caulobacteraceae bacterium]